MVNTLKHKDKYQQKEYMHLAFPEKKKNLWIHGPIEQPIIYELSSLNKILY